MITTVSTLLGGIGLFLLGMILLTDGLKALAGDALRAWLARFTGSRLSAVATGAGVTAIVQSSSATTLATIGFVSAGLLSFQNSIGVIIGTNIGTTSTGWIVSLLGLKLSMGTLAMPLIGVGALLRLLGRERLAHAGTALAGFGVIFVGIDVLQAGMAGLAQRLDLSQFAAAGLGPRLVLVAVGAVMTILMQSSSAAVATTLTALAAGTISLDQAAALVIGQNLGTSAKAGVAAIGASAPAKRTALVHLVFNVGTGLVAFALLPLFLLAARTFTGSLVEDDPAVAIAAFHTAFNLLGAAIFLPLTPHLARLATHLIPERRPPATRYLDPSLHEVPAVAVDAAFKALRSTLKSLLRMVIQGLQPQGVGLPSMRETDRALDVIRGFLKDVSPPAGSRELQRLVELLHVLDHVTALRDDLREIAELDTARTSAALRPITQWLAGELQALLAGLEHEDEVPDATRAEAIALHLKEERRSARPHILSATAQRQAQLDQALRDLAAQRWLDAIAGHVARAVVHLRGVRDG